MQILKIIIALSFLFSANLLSQSLYVGFGSGLNFINGGSYYTSKLGRIGIYENINGTNTSFSGLGLGKELQFQIGAKYSLANSPISLVANVEYYRMRGNESMNIFSEFMKRDFLYDVSTKLNIWSFQLGSSYSFDLFSLKPFVFASILSNYFDDVYVELAQDRTTTEFLDYENGMRYGFAFGGGIFYNNISNFGLEILTKYNIFNFLNRREGEEKINSVSVLFNAYYKIFWNTQYTPYHRFSKWRTCYNFSLADLEYLGFEL